MQFATSAPALLLSVVLLCGFVIVARSADHHPVRPTGFPRGGLSRTSLLSGPQHGGALAKETALNKTVRRQRQIKFKSSYSELPDALRQAEEQRTGKTLSGGRVPDEADTDEQLEPRITLDEQVQVIAELSAGKSEALHHLLPSSEVYFPPEVEAPIKIAESSMERKIAKGKSRSSLRSQSEKTSFTKQGRLLRKKMIGKKLIRPETPKPTKIERNTDRFQTSSTKNVENTIRTNFLTSQRLQQSSELRSAGHLNQNNHSGGPNPNESFKNPFYVETPPHVRSSYSFVPESSPTLQKSSSGSHQRQSETPTPSKLDLEGPSKQHDEHPGIFHRKRPSEFHPDHPSKLHHERPGKLHHERPGKLLHESPGQLERGDAAKNSHLVSSHNKPASKSRKHQSKSHRKMNHHPKPANRGKQLLTSSKSFSKTEESSPSLDNWQHFLLKSEKTTQEDHTPIQRNRSPIKKQISVSNTNSINNKVFNSPTNQASRKGKSFSTALEPAGKSSFPNLISIPKTSFSCGSHKSGEYFADLQTNCQVFHVCFGGRQASFVCPVGTAFSQKFLVCDWWHKVQCDGSHIRSRRTSLPLTALLPITSHAGGDAAEGVPGTMSASSNYWLDRDNNHKHVW